MSRRPTPQPSAIQSIEEIDAELARLDAVDEALEEALADFDHQLRRVADGLVRAGFVSPNLEHQKQQLQGNRKRTLSDLEKNRAARRALQVRRAEAKKQTRALRPP